MLHVLPHTAYRFNISLAQDQTIAVSKQHTIKNLYLRAEFSKMSKNLKYILGISLVAALFFIPLIGRVHLFDWDEINFAEASREMLVLKDFLRVHIDFVPFFQKPPLFFWLQSLSMSIFGVNEFSARFPNAVCGIITLVLLFRIGKATHNAHFGFLWTLAYFGSILPFLYFKSGIIDPWFNLFIFLSIYHIIRASTRSSREQGLSSAALIILAGSFAGLAILTKGPVALLVIGLTWIVYKLIYERQTFFKLQLPILFLLFCCLVAMVWFGVEYMNNGSSFLEEFIRYQIKLLSTEDAGHGGFFGYHFVILFFGVFPASIFALFELFKKRNIDVSHSSIRQWMIVLLLVVVILFTIVQSKIIHYSSLAYFPLTYLAALGIRDLIKGKRQMPGWVKSLTIGVGVIFFIAVAALPFVGMNIGKLSPYFEGDPFASKAIMADTSWSYLGIIPAILLACALIFFVWMNKRNEFQKAFLGLFIGVALFSFTALVFSVKNIEAYSQNAAIEFYKSLQGEDCYVRTIGFKSYAHHFYARTQPSENLNYRNKEWLLTGEIDKPVYLVTKSHKSKSLEIYKDIKLIEHKNGFAFFKRMPE